MLLLLEARHLQLARLPLFRFHNPLAHLLLKCQHLLIQRDRSRPINSEHPLDREWYSRIQLAMLPVRD